MKKILMVGMLAGLFSLNSQANGNGDDFWFPNEHGSSAVESVVSNEAEEAWQGATQRVEVDSLEVDQESD